MSIALLTLLLLGLTEISWARSCVLFFERAHHPFAKVLQKNLGAEASVDLFIEPAPLEFNRCFENPEITKIIFIAHSMSNAPEGRPLLYYRRLEGAARLDYLRQAEEVFRDGRSRTDQRTQKFIQQALEDESIPIYNGPKPFLSQIFRLALQSPVKVSQKEIHFFACRPDQVLLRYPEIQSLRDSGITVFFEAPRADGGVPMNLKSIQRAIKNQM